MPGSYKKFKRLKLELFYLQKAFRQYRKGFKYVYNKFYLSRKILASKKVLEKAINNNDLSWHVLTSHSDLVILFWSLASLYRVSEIIGQLYIHSDGSLNLADKNRIKYFLPSAILLEPEEILNQNNSELNQYPLLKKARTEVKDFFLLMKLIDPYLVSNKRWHLIIDSDLLWFRCPADIKKQINNPTQPSLMIKDQSGSGNYIYFKDGTKLADELAKYNSGIVLYQKPNFDLKKLNEYLEKIDLSNKQNRHFIEQAGYAYCLKNLIGWPSASYHLAGSVSQQTVVRHYTSPRRPLFYIEGLEQIKSMILNN